MRYLVLSAVLSLSTVVDGINFPFESIQLTEAETANFPAIRFGSYHQSHTYKPSEPNCKSFPGTPEWPIDEEWTKLNNSLSGALLKPDPPAAVCYPGPLFNAAQCNFLLRNASSTRFYIDDPLTVLSQWTQGSTCPAILNPTTNCTRGGFPSYVVNVTTVKQIQIAVNFARNKNIRLIIKNTGHDFVGKSAGAGSISIWTHFLKDFEYLPKYHNGKYFGRAARVGAGLEGWETYKYMDANDMSLVIPSGPTVGAYGGWMAGGGHGLLASLYGLGSDQPLSLQVVTADGRFVTADPDTNEDLYYALRGGGPSTYGVVTSAVVKAYPSINVSESTILFSSAMATNVSAFWAGVDRFFAFGADVVDNGGTTYNYVFPAGPNAFSFRVQIEMPGKTNSETFAFVQPFINDLNVLGINITNPQPVKSIQWGTTRHGEGDVPGDGRFATRLFPRKNWDDGPLFKTTMASIRNSVEGGYTFHGIHMGPSEAVAGYPHNAVNPAFRNTVMHADVFDVSTAGKTPAQQIEQYNRFETYMAPIREATKGSGAYINEADALEPDFQHSFWGNKYEGLLRIKKERDPWQLFWALTTVGSEGWEVKTENGLPSQNGRLCRIAGA